MGENLKQAIGYIRVSTARQDESGFGHDMQRAQIEAYGKAAGIRIKKVFSEVASGVGPDSLRKRSELQEALDEAERRKFPIIVASICRLSRDCSSVQKLLEENKVRIIVAKLDLNVNQVVLISEAARAQEEGRLLSIRTKNGLKKAKQRGVLLGNTTNLKEAQAKGTAANARVAQLRTKEQFATIDEAIVSGAKSASDIARYLDAKGVPTARGIPWTKDNVHRLLKARHQASASILVKVDLPSIADEDGRLTAHGIARIQSALDKQKMKLGQVMVEIGYSALDACFGNAVRCKSRIKDPEKIRMMDKWLEAKGAV